MYLHQLSHNRKHFGQTHQLSPTQPFSAHVQLCQRPKYLAHPKSRYYFDNLLQMNFIFT